MPVGLVPALVRTAAVAAIAAAALAVGASAAGASVVTDTSATTGTVSSPSLGCTFTVNRRYRSAVTIDVAFLQDLGVPGDEVHQVLNNMAAKARTIPVDWNVHCVPQGTLGPSGNPNSGATRAGRLRSSVVR